MKRRIACQLYMRSAVAFNGFIFVKCCMLTLHIHCRKIVSKIEQIRKPPEFYNIFHLTTFICQYCELFFCIKCNSDARFVLKVKDVEMFITFA